MRDSIQSALEDRYGLPSYTEGMPIVRSLQHILRLGPAVPVFLQLTKWAGQQILYQDAACTIPVESIGDPIGGVRHPVTGEIILVQTTDADRPTWGGVLRGAIFDGISYLENTTDTDLFDPKDQPFTVTVRAVADSSGGGDIRGLWVRKRGADERRYYSVLEADGQYRLQIDDGVDTGFFRDGGAHYDDTEHDFAQVLRRGTDVTQESWVDGAMGGSETYSSFGTLADDGVFSLGNNVGAGVLDWLGDIRFFAFYRRDLSQSEIETVHSV